MSTATLTKSTVTEADAYRAQHEVTKQFALWTEPVFLPAEDGQQELTLSPVCEPPTLIENWDGFGHWGLVWLDGPRNWAYRINPVSGLVIEPNCDFAVLLRSAA